MPTYKAPICLKCKHFDLDNKLLSCEAYTNGIPDKILTGEIDHTEPYKGDNNIQFEPIKVK